jgi:hypothetical protein
VGALDGFRVIWTNANAVFGQGIPSGGAQFDQSAELRRLQNTVTSARPDGRWTGAASDSYGDANGRHARTLGGIADLDRRLGLEVDRAAAVVTAGRRDLEAVRQRVSDAAASVPNTAAGERMLYPAISKGSSDIQEILNRSHGDMSEIGDRIRGIGNEYQALSDGEGKGGKKLDKVPTPKTPNTTLDLDDIEYQDPGALGPANHVEIGPGTWIPDNNHPGVEPSPPKAPLDYKDIEYVGPGSGPPHEGMMELVPGSGAWVPDPNSAGYAPHVPEVPVDMARAKILEPGELAESGMIPIYPGARIAIPDPNAGAPR